MNWFGILKEDKVLPKMREFQFAGERKISLKSRMTDAEKKLKEKFLKLKDKNESLQSSSMIFPGKVWEGEINTHIAGHDGGRYVSIFDPQSIDKLVEIFDNVSEEMCCSILEAIQEMVVAGRSWYTEQIKDARDDEFFEVKDFPLWSKTIGIPDEYGFDETAYISLYSEFLFANRLNFSLSIHRKDESGTKMQYGYAFFLDYKNTGLEGRSLGTVDENVTIRFRKNMIVFMNFILTMKD